MKTYTQYLNEARFGVQLNTMAREGLSGMKPAQPARMKEGIAVWINKTFNKNEESDTTWKDVAVALDLGDRKLWTKLLTDKATGSPLDVDPNLLIAELTKILGAKPADVQKAWKKLGSNADTNIFDDPAEVKRWVKARM